MILRSGSQLWLTNCALRGNARLPYNPSAPGNSPRPHESGGAELQARPKENASGSPSGRIGRSMPAPDEVSIWRVTLSLPSSCLPLLERILSEEEIKRSSRFCFSEDRRRFVSARSALRMILSGCIGVPPDSLAFATGDNGKPRLIRHDERIADIRFNLSHSGEMALVAVTRGREVGVDIECVRNNISHASLARRFFAAEEREALEATPPEERLHAFFRCWTRKEAYLKAVGAGLSVPLDRFAVSLERGRARVIRPIPGDWRGGDWSLTDLDIGEGYAASLAVEGGGCHVIQRDFHAASADPWQLLSSG